MREYRLIKKGDVDLCPVCCASFDESPDALEHINPDATEPPYLFKCTRCGSLLERIYKEAEDDRNIGNKTEAQ